MRRILILLLLVFASLSLSYSINYSVELSQYKDTRTLVNSISFNQRLTQRLTMAMDASFTADRSDDLDRFLDARSGSGRISRSLL